MKSYPEVVAPNLIAAFTATHDPNRPLTIGFNDESIGGNQFHTYGVRNMG